MTPVEARLGAALDVSYERYQRRRSKLQDTKDIHRRAQRRLHATITRARATTRSRSRVNLFITSTTLESRKYIIRVCRDDQLAHRKPHALRVIAGEDIAKVARRNHELDLGVFGMRDLFAGLEVGEEVVDCLGKNTRPVDRIDCAEMVFLVEGSVHEQRLHNILERKREDCPPMTRAQNLPGTYQKYPLRRYCTRWSL